MAGILIKFGREFRLRYRSSAMKGFDDTRSIDWCGGKWQSDLVGGCYWNPDERLTKGECGAKRE